MNDDFTTAAWEHWDSLPGMTAYTPSMAYAEGAEWARDHLARQEATDAEIEAAALEAAEHRATRAEAKADVRANQTAHWQEQAGIWQEHAQWLSERAVQAEARIDAATTVLDEDTRWQNEEHLLARVREALDGDA